jgi:hypothetical protein
MEHLYPDAGEKFSGDLFCYTVQLKKFVDAYTADGEKQESFQQAAVLQGYVEEQIEAVACFRNASIQCTPFKLRSMFVQMCLHGFPMLQVFNKARDFESMSNDYLRRANLIQSEQGRRNQFLKDISKLFSEHGRKLQDFGLPELKKLRQS